MSLKSGLSRPVRNALFVYSDTERKPVLRIAMEFVKLSISTRCVATHYFGDYLYTNYITNYMDYLSHNESHLIQDLINNEDTKNLTGDKMLCHSFLSNGGIPVPRLLGHSVRERLLVAEGAGWADGEMLTWEDMREAFTGVLANTTAGAFFVKPVRGVHGAGIIRVSDQFLREGSAELENVHRQIVSGSYLMQDGVVQHPDLDRFNPNCLNTVRIDTFKEPGSVPEILSARFRIGRFGSHVDNVGAGGSFVGINLEDGTLKELLFTKFGKGEPVRRDYTSMGVRFAGWTLPYFDELKKVTIEAATLLPGGLAGWDVGISAAGPVVIECNIVYYGMAGQDLAYGGYRRNPVYQKAVAYVEHRFGRRAGKRVSRLGRYCYGAGETTSSLPPAPE